MRATFLGHQGWLLGSGETRWLVDPLLTRSFGHRGSVGEVYPPRRFEPESLPPVDAIVLSHEHEDHFDVPSLVGLDRAIPVLLSERMSRASESFLVEQGFSVRRFGPLAPARVGALELVPLWSDVRASDDDEWDVLPFVVHDGVDAFCTSVDVALPEAALREVARIVRGPIVFAAANNHTSLHFQNGRPPASAESASADVAAAVVADVRRLTSAGVRVASVLVCGGGLSFQGERAWMNRHAFPAPSSDVAAAMRTSLPGVFVGAPLPGEALPWASGEVGALEPSGFLAAAPRDAWPDRTYTPSVRLHDAYGPATGERTMSATAWDALREELRQVARWLYATPTFRSLLSLAPNEVAGRRRRLALMLLHDEDEEEATLLEYDPTAADFTQSDSTSPIDDYVAGFECWATDLLALLQVEVSPTAVLFGRCRSWSHVGAELDLASVFWACRHPLSAPERWLQFYRRLAAGAREGARGDAAGARST